MVDVRAGHLPVDDPAPEQGGEIFEAGGIENEAGVSLADPAQERRLLGALMVDHVAFSIVADHIFEEDFFDRVHRRLFVACRDAFDAGYAVSMKLLVEALGGDADATMGGDMTVSAFIARLMAGGAPADELEAIAVAIHEAADRRANEMEDMHADLTPFVSRMGLRMWRDQNSAGPQYEYLIEDLIPERQCVLLIGDTQTGKSFLATHMSMCGVRAKPFFGRRITEPFGVVWCAYEAAEGAPARMRAYRKHHDLALDNLPFGALTRPLKLWPDPEMKNVDAVIHEIREIERTEFGGVRLGMVVIDTHNAGTPGASEIDSEVISKIRDHYQKIVQELGATLLIVGHTNSAGKHRGNEQLSNNVDTIIKISLKTRTIGRDVIQLKDDDRRDIRTMRVMKQREGQSGGEHDFILRVVEDGTTNRFGKPRTSCVVATPNLPDDDRSDDFPESASERYSGAKISKQETLFLQCILDATAEHGVPPPAGLDLPHSAGNVVDYDIVKKMMSDKMMREDDNTEEGRKSHRNRVKSAVRRARENLTFNKVVAGHSATNLIWWTGKAARGMAATQPKTRDLLSDGPDNGVDLGEFA